MTKGIVYKRMAQEPIQPAYSLQSASCMQSTTIELHVIKSPKERNETRKEIKPRIQKWLQEATLLIDSLQIISLSQKEHINLSIEEWLKEQKENGEAALLTRLLQSIISSPKLKNRPYFQARLKNKRNTQHFQQSNKRIAKALAKKVSPSQKRTKNYFATAVDKPLNEIGTSLANASRSMPDARLVIRSRYINIKDLSATCTTRRPARADSFRHIFGVVQNIEHVEFVVKMNIQFDTRMEPFGFWCDIIHDPTSDNCLLYNHSGLSIYLTHPGKLSREQKIDPGIHENIYPGLWRISTKPDQTTSSLYPIFEVLVCHKSFSILAEKENRVFTVQGTDIFTRDAQAIQYTSTGLSEVKPSIMDLTDGETVCIKALPEKKTRTTDTYNLQRIEKIASSSKTSVFSCRLSTLPKSEVVAKVFSPKELRHAKVRWKREKEILEKLIHPNIVSLKAYDSRLLVLYLEHLPLSLNFTNYYTPKCGLIDAESILHGISSALEYLSTQNIVHHDVKPSNISYCYSRGAVLMDFDLARSVDPEDRTLCGTPMYLPPEILKQGESCGFPGDVWALGLTVLYLLGKIDRSIAQINLHDIKQRNSPSYNSMEEWLEQIASKRCLLDLQHKVEWLLFQMLEPESEVRVTAAAIKLELEGGQSAENQEHD